MAEVTLECGLEAWTVRVLGRSGGRFGGETTPLLLLGFTPEGFEGSGELREALVVARSLAGLSREQLERAFEASSPRDS